ncbi:kinase-like domain-containing protein, partial [Lyophyllum atratum]
LEDVFENINQYKRLLGSRDREAQQLLDTFQLLLDTPGLSAKFRRNLLVAMQRLSKRAGLYPTYYNLKGVELTSEHPVAAGSFADIYKGRHLGQTVCLKVVRLYQTSHVASFLQKFAAEAILWGQLSHPNLLPIFGLYQYTTRLCLISPWMENGDVISFLREHPQSNRLLLILDVASGIGYLHENHIVHGDLKGAIANILVSESGRACLADFGLSSVSDTNILHWTSNSSAGSKGGSVRWQAPELFDVETDDIVYNSMFSDVYAFACVAYEIFTGNVPFFEIPRDPAVMRKVQTGGTPSPPPASSLAWRSWGLTRPHWELMKVCWSGNPAGRPSIQRVMAHFASKKPHDERPVGNVNIVSREAFRDSVNAGLELPSVDDIKAILDDFSDSSAL